MVHCIASRQYFYFHINLDLNSIQSNLSEERANDSFIESLYTFVRNEFIYDPSSTFSNYKNFIYIHI